VSTLQYISQRSWTEGPRYLPRLVRYVRFLSLLNHHHAKYCSVWDLFVWILLCAHVWYFLFLTISMRKFSVSLLSLTPWIETQHYCRFRSRNWTELFGHVVCVLLHSLNAWSFTGALQYPALASAASSVCDMLITISVTYFLRTSHSQSSRCGFLPSSIGCSINVTP